MKRKKYGFQLFLPLLLTLLLAAGCGSSTHHKTAAQDDDGATPTPVLTGDVTLFPNSGLLATAEELLAAINSDDSGEMVLLDTRSADAYASGHIPGAINVEWTAFVLWNDPPEKATLKPVADLEAQLGTLGLTRTSRIVIYDDTVTSWGAAGRIFWMLEYLGCGNVQILNGGWDKWAADDLSTETTENTLDAAAFSADLTLFPGVNVNKEYILSRLGETDFAVVDTRTDEEYNGWILYDEARGGHIRGAVQLPYGGYYNGDKSILSYTDLKTLLDSNGITLDKEVVSYCTAGIRSGFFYFLGRLMGYDVSNYDASIWDWAAADATTYPMDKMENYQTLVYPSWVKSLIDYHAPGSTASAPSGYGYDRDHKYLIFETQWGSFEDMEMGWADDSYLKGHIPGAVHSNSDVYENGYPRWFLLPEAELKTAMGSMGITADTTVVVYSNSPIFVARLWWILKYAGVADVRVLNGGYDAWTAAGYDGETAINEAIAATYDGTLVPGLIATTDYVEANYDTGDTVMADVRTYPEYAGEISGYGYVVNKGRIPGAVYAFNADTPDLEYLDSDGTLKSSDGVKNMWSSLGITSTIADNRFDKDVIFYCGSGYRSSLSFLYAYLMGVENVRNYSDGWEGWSTKYIEDATYVAEEDVPGSTDGWIQDPSGRLVAYGVHPEWDFDGYPNVNRVVDAKWVKEVLLENDNFGKPYVIAHVSWGQAGNSYTGGHIPGAIHINTDEIEYDCFNARDDWPVDAGEPACWDRSTTEEEDLAKGLTSADSLPRNWWNIYPDEYLMPAFAYMGIDKDTTVVLYGSGGSAEARVLWALMYAGATDVRILEGGYNAWVAAGYEGSTDMVTRNSLAEFGTDVALNPEYLVDIPYVRNVVDGTLGDALLVDIRTEDEYMGASRPYSYIPTDGRIPGALWGTDEFTHEDKTFKAPSDIEGIWAARGITSDEHLSFYCGTAWRSSLAWLYAYMMGYPDISNFDSSWFEWSMGEGSAYNGDDPVLNPVVDESPDLP